MDGYAWGNSGVWWGVCSWEPRVKSKQDGARGRGDGAEVQAGHSDSSWTGSLGGDREREEGRTNWGRPTPPCEFNSPFRWTLLSRETSLKDFKTEKMR